MKDEYVIINKTAILKRVEILERLYKTSEKPSIQGTIYNQLSIDLKQILSQSTPLIPVVEDAFREGSNYGGMDKNYVAGDYISNLKLDI